MSFELFHHLWKVEQNRIAENFELQAEEKYLKWNVSKKRQVKYFVHGLTFFSLNISFCRSPFYN